MRLLSVSSIDIINDHLAVKRALIVLALAALAVITTEYPSLEALAILLEAS